MKPDDTKSETPADTLLSLGDAKPVKPPSKSHVLYQAKNPGSNYEVRGANPNSKPAAIANPATKRGRMGKPGPVDKDGLTPGLRRFILEYVRCLDTTAAALAAGYAPHTAKIADTWLHRPHVKRAIDTALAAVEKRYTLDAASILKELARVAMADPRRLFDEDGNVRPVTSWSADDAACIAQVEVVKRNVFAGDGRMDTVMKIRLWDKPKTLEILAKHLGLLTERLEIRGDAELIEKLSAARKRVAVAVAIEE